MGFSMPLHMDLTSIVVPMKIYKSLLSFADPLTFEVWMMFFISIPIYMLAMLLADYIYPAASTDWEGVVGFVFRNAVMEHNAYIQVAALHQKIFFLVWTASTFILLQGYSGNLKAMITRPILEMEIRNAEDLLGQEELKWVVQDGTGYIETLKASSSGSTRKSLLEKADYLTIEEEYYSACFNVKHHEAGTYASICDRDDIRNLILLDYINTGTCNYYVTDDNISTSMLTMMFQVQSSKTIHDLI